MDLATYQRKTFEAVVGDVGVTSFKLLEGMSGSLSYLNGQILDLRASAMGQTLLLRAILKRDELQQHLEELIYQGQKMVAAFCGQTCPVQPTHRALLLRSFTLWIKNAEIGTESIRGLENKKAFDQMLSDAKLLYRQLQADAEVRKAIEVERKKEAEAEERLAEASEQRLKVFKALLHAIRDAGYTVASKERESMRIHFQTGLSLRSFGQNVVVRADEYREGKFELHFQNENEYEGLTDWGEGASIAKKIFIEAKDLLADEGMATSLTRYRTA